MTVKFKRPTNRPNWRKAIEKLIPAAPSGATLAAAAATGAAAPAFIAAFVGFGASMLKAIFDAVEAADPSHSNDERAWVWLRVSLVAATLELLGMRELRASLDEEERREAVRTFLADALALDGEGELDIATVVNPANCRLLDPVREKLPALVRQVAPDHALTDDALQAAFARLLRAASARVYALDTSYYGQVAEAVTGPFAEGARRDLAWARHEDWIRGLFQREPIFSPDADETIPLSAVYHRLRCFWHEEIRPERDDDAQERADRSERRLCAHVADLHTMMHAWLRSGDRGDAIRVVAGGPGSGKSSFSRAFAVEVIEAGDHRVIYLPLQHMRLGADLWNLIGVFLRGRWHATDPEGGKGFESNPLDWRAYETLPYLLVFDGLDELSHDDDTARDLARKFIRSVYTTLASIGGPRVRALVLGRSAACQEALAEADLDLRHLLHVAPLTPLTEDGRASPALGNVDVVEDPSQIAEGDERPEFWRRSATARDLPAEPTPEAVTADALHELNAEPLLLHLLIVSGYAGANWREAAENRNLVYRAIFRSVFERNRRKDHPATRNIDEADFFTLLECLGLAAWRGNGRTGSEQDFAALRDLHATGKQRQRFGQLPAAELRNVAIQFHTRRDADSGGFEFIHKSFGEYLAARGLLRAGLRAARLLLDGDDPRTEAEVAEHWTRLVASAEPSEEILRFLVDEARLAEPSAVEAALPPLTKVFNWTIAHGMPVQKVTPGAHFRDLETMQRCGESALLAVLNALDRSARHIREEGRDRTEKRSALPIEWGPNTAPMLFLHRVRATLDSPLKLALGCLDLSGANLIGADLSGANLSGADLSGAGLSGANLSGADLSGADLRGADLSRGDLSAANLSGADLRQANLIWADLRQANLIWADLRRADLIGANLRHANLSRADLSGADLRGADLGGADLSGADLSGANLARAFLFRANLSGADLRQADLSDWMCAQASLRCARFQDSKCLSLDSVKSAFGVRRGIGRTILPDGMIAPAHWHEAADDDQDTGEALRAYEAALAAWRARVGAARD